MNDAALCVDGRFDFADATHHSLCPESFPHTVQVSHPIERGKQHRVLTYSRCDVIQSLLQGVRLDGEQNRIEGCMEGVFGSYGRCDAEIAVRADHLNAASAQRFGACRANEERYVTACLRQTRTEKSAGGSRTYNQHSHFISLVLIIVAQI